MMKFHKIFFALISLINLSSHIFFVEWSEFTSLKLLVLCVTSDVNQDSQDLMIVGLKDWDLALGVPDKGRYACTSVQFSES